MSLILTPFQHHRPCSRLNMYFVLQIPSHLFCVCVLSTCTVEQISSFIVIVVQICFRLISLTTFHHLQPLVVVKAKFLGLDPPPPLLIVFLKIKKKCSNKCVACGLRCTQPGTCCLRYCTYSDDVQGVVTHFSDFCILVMHQIDQVRWRLWRTGLKKHFRTLLRKSVSTSPHPNPFGF